MTTNVCGKSILCFAIVLLSASRSSAQGDAPSLGLGTHIFRRALHVQGIAPLTEWQDLWNEPESNILIVLGDTRPLSRLHEGLLVSIGLDRFLRDGGAILIATDRFDPTDCLARMGYAFEGITLSVEDRMGYRQSEECPFLRFTAQGARIFSGLTQVATNRPSYLRPHGLVTRSLPILAQLSNARRRSGNTLFISPSTIMVVGGPRENGKILAVADHSIFINAMLWQEDNENHEFAYHVVDFLSDGGKRKRALFVEEGAIQSVFDIPFKDVPLPPLPPPEQILAVVDQFLHTFEEENRFNRLVTSIQDGIERPDMLRSLILFGTLAIGIFCLTRLSFQRFRHENGVPVLADCIAEARLTSPLADARAQALASQGNYWEIARARAGLVVSRLTGSAPTSAVKSATDLMQRLEIDESVWQPRQVKKMLQETAVVAFAVQPTWINIRKWHHLEHTLDNLSQALDEGTLRVLEAQSPIRRS